MRLLICFVMTGLSLLALSVGVAAEDKCYDVSSVEGAESHAPGLTADEAEAYGPTAVAADYALRELAAPVPSQAQWAFRAAMNRLWEDHIAYTRNFIIAAAAGSPAADDVVARLMQNQVDIGNAVKPYYGSAAGDQVTSLLKEHIALAGEVVTAAKAGDNAKLADANKRWLVNADAIAAFLSKANPQAWPEASVKQMMHEHLALTTSEAQAELGGDWQGSIAAYDKVHQQILMMSGALADGIIQQFPDRF